MKYLIDSLYKNIDNPLASHAIVHDMAKQLCEESMSIEILRSKEYFSLIITKLKDRPRSVGDKFNRLVKKAFRMAKAIVLIKELKDNQSRQTIVKMYLDDNTSFNIIREFSNWLSFREFKNIKNHIKWCEKNLLTSKEQEKKISKVRSIHNQYKTHWICKGKTEQELEKALKLSNRCKNLMYMGEQKDLINRIKNLSLSTDDLINTIQYNSILTSNQQRPIIFSYFQLLDS